MKTLITGAAGFIGSHVADHCLALGMEVVATDDLSGGFQENVPKKSHWVQGNLTNPAFCTALFKNYGPFDSIYHLAAYAAEGLSHFIRHHNYQTNLITSINLINESIKQEAIEKKIPHFIFTSSIAVYGAGQTPMTETLTPIPEDPYGISKYATELDIKAAHEMFGLDYTIFRPHNVYGPRQNVADKYRNVIGIFMNQILQNKPMPIFGDGLQTRAFSYIDDVAPLIAQSSLIPSAKNEIFNIGADTPYTILELALEIAKAFRKKPNILHLDARNEVIHAFSDHSKLNLVFSDRKEPTTLQDGITKMAEWVITKGPQKPTTFENIEVEKNLPSSWTKSSSAQSPS